MIPVLMTVNDPLPGFQGCDILQNQMCQKQCKIEP